MARDFAAALREADRRLGGRGMPAGAERRVLARLRVAEEARAARAAAPSRARRRPRNAPRRWLAVPALAMAALALFALVFARRAASPVAGPVVMEQVAGFVVVARSEDLLLRGEATTVDVARGRCTLRDEVAGMTLEVDGGARLVREGAAVRVASGKVGFAVDPRRTEAPRRIAVSQGEIRITGTRFTVEERGAAGHVTLHEGGIEFVAPGREPVRLLPGQALAWPLLDEVSLEQLPDAAAAPVASVALPAPALPMASVSSPAAPPAPPGDEALPVDAIARIEALRSQGRYAEAAALAASTPGSATTRERLSYEQGGIYTWQLRDRDKACAHWRDHAARYPNGRYAVEVARARQQLGCN
jgi:transmembrane sensor